MTLRLIVKGDRLVAAKAAADRGVPFVFVRETMVTKKHTQTVGRTGDEHRAAVKAWFAELPKRRPFPAGTLLHWLWEGLDGDFSPPERKR
jgi:hypothetical protein